jgi:hypothetical protein
MSRLTNGTRANWRPLWSRGGLEFLATDPEFRVRFPALPDFLRSSGSGTGSTQHREYYWGAAWKKKYRLWSRKPRLRPQGFVTLITWHPLSAKFGTNFAESGGRSVGIVRSRTQAKGFLLPLRWIYSAGRNIWEHYLILLGLDWWISPKDKGPDKKCCGTLKNFSRTQCKVRLCCLMLPYDVCDCRTNFSSCCLDSEMRPFIG